VLDLDATDEEIEQALAALYGDDEAAENGIRKRH
jgi:hypothetical protein